ncbi:hypothetical protein FACS1894195_1330 [Bacteroidia bacterium]|nr:hypothetical protein FACS1894195_1330 [Bacteroidia bacterium]
MLYFYSSTPEHYMVRHSIIIRIDVRDMNKELLYTITLCPTSKKDRFLKRIKTGAAQEATPEEKKEEAEATQEVVPEASPEAPAEAQPEAKEEEVKEDAP